MKDMILKAGVKVKGFKDSMVEEVKEFIKGSNDNCDAGISEMVYKIGFALLGVVVIIAFMTFANTTLGSGTGTGSGGTGLFGALEEKLFDILN